MCCKLCKSVLLFVIPLNSRVHMCGVCVPEIGISQSASAGKNADSNPQRQTVSAAPVSVNIRFHLIRFSEQLETVICELLFL